MKKKNLLSIGELSKITGVHIKELRYYDHLGILKPIYTDPSSGYRYYSFYQKSVVDAIQFCVGADIPLRTFPDYTNDAVPWICYKDLVSHGTELVEEKIRVLQQRLSRLKAMQKEIERSENSYANGSPAEYDLPQRYCWITPYEGTLGSAVTNELIKKLILKIFDSGLKLGNINGSILLKENDEWKQYLFVDVSGDIEKIKCRPDILCIPAGRYLCKKIDRSNIRGVWNWCLHCVNEEDIELIIESELFMGNYAFSAPVMEQRCLLKAHKN